MDAITKDLQKPAPWTLLHADDVMLASEDKGELDVQTWTDRLAMFGLRLNVKKTECSTTDSNEPGSFKIKALSSHGQQPSSTLDRRLRLTAAWVAAWLKWRLMTGVLCNKNIPERLNPKSTEPSSGPSRFTALSAGLRPKK
nr:endonuclease-reverse transcriptase HmRTE-e01 [Haemonchus contortus]